jgi:hypothetical protein
MKKVIASLFLAAVILAMAVFALSSRAMAGPVPLPPDGDWPTWRAILESRRCFEKSVAHRLRASGRDWSYEQYRRRISISVRPEKRSISVRVYFSSQPEAEELAALARDALLEFIEPIQAPQQQRP